MNEQTVISSDILASSTAIALLEAGIEQFGLFGLKATTRSIAETAKANIAAIPYYFRSKQGLYQACMHYIVDNIWRDLGAKITQLKSNEDSLNVEDAHVIFVDIMDSFCAYFMEGDATVRWSQFIMREHTTPTDAYEIFYTRYYQQVQAIQAKLWAKCTNQSASDPIVSIQCHAMFGQVLGFLVARQSILRALDSEAFTPEQIAQTRRVVRQNVHAILQNTKSVMPK